MKFFQCYKCTFLISRVTRSDGQPQALEAWPREWSQDKKALKNDNRNHIVKRVFGFKNGLELAATPLGLWPSGGCDGVIQRGQFWGCTGELRHRWRARGSAVIRRSGVGPAALLTASATLLAISSDGVDAAAAAQPFDSNIQ